MKVNYLGLQYVHKFINNDGEVQYVTCSIDDFNSLTEKPTLEGYEYQYTVGDMVKVDTPSGLLEQGQYTEDEEGKIIECYEDNGQPTIKR